MVFALCKRLLMRLRCDSMYVDLSVADITELTALTNLPDGRVIRVRDADRGGTFAFTTGGTVEDDSGITFNADDKKGVFTRQEIGRGYNPKWWGAKGDDSHDDTDAFTRCIAAVEREYDNPMQHYVGKSGSSAFKHNTAYVDVTPGVYRITSPLRLINASIIGRSKSSCVLFHDVSTEVDLFYSPEYPVTGVRPGSDASSSFEIAGDHKSVFVPHCPFKVVESSGNDGRYTVSAVEYDDASGMLTISVAEAVPDGTPDGSIRLLNTGYAIDIHNLTLVGSGNMKEDLEGTPSGRIVVSRCAVNLYQAIWSCSISNVIISQFHVGIRADDCWGLRIEDSLIFNCPRCLEWHSAIMVDCANTRFEACYDQAAGESEHGVYIGRRAAPPQSVSFTGCGFQGAGKAGVYVHNATNIAFNSCFFERNDLEDGGNAYCEIRTTGGWTSATFTGCVWTPADAAVGDSLCLRLDGVRKANIIGCEMRDGWIPALQKAVEFRNSIVADSQCDLVNLVGTVDKTNNGMDLHSSTCVFGAPQTALTPAEGGSPDTGDLGTDSIIANVVTRVDELETKLQALGLIE